MQSHTAIISICLLATTALIAGFFTYLQNIKRQLYLRVWSVGWYLLVLHFVCEVLDPRLGASGWLICIGKSSLAAAAAVFFCAARIYVHARPLARWAASAGIAVILWIFAFQVGAIGITPQFGIAFLFFSVAWVFWQEGRSQETYADLLMAIVFVLWGAMAIVRLAFGKPGFGPTPDFAVLSSVPLLMAALLTVMVLYEEEKRRVQRNILALSNLNLTTSSFIGEEIQKTLSQALERVLSVVHLSAGVICLNDGSPKGSMVVASLGLDASFCKAAQEDRLDDDLKRLVARMGGLVVFRDLGRDNSWAALDREPAFVRFRQLAVSHNLKTVVAISLQAKEEPFGVLLLATPEVRRFTQAELRLLLALGHQIGMAVENSYLMQQTSRRSEELQVLNEIGRALSSTLDLDELFEKIFSALQRMFDVNNFYIALFDAKHSQIHFELEIADGIRLPKRTRPLGSHLTEYIIRTRQPLLFQKNLLAEAGKLGLNPVQTEGSFCGVPLMVCDRAIGVLAVRGVEEQLYDEGHLEMMRVLASAASIAIENARLFREEQSKSRQLTLLNNISKNSIATLSPAEMLANIAEQLEQGLAFDHIGIGVLDYASKEVIIEAEAGRRRGALRRRLGLNDCLVGRVARTGEMCVAREIAHTHNADPVLEDSASAIALPVVYAEQLLGVLYVETAELTRFSAEEVLLLHTLADVIAGALHNALTFQKAQEQAITDGLTGVKTHRFFMEALSAEWKRATRASRAFCLVLIDLDRFKFVNDFYGHLEGDLVLTRVGNILEQCCRRSDTVARYGGDEFVVLMPETNVDQGLALAQKLRSALSADPLMREKNIAASFGIAAFPVHGSTPQELIQVADASMYLSKHKGGNTVSTADHYDPNETKKWKRDVLEAYLGVTLKRLFSTGPEAFEEIRGRLEQFARSLNSTETDIAGLKDRLTGGAGREDARTLPQSVVETVSSLALAIDAKDHYMQGHSQKVGAYAVLIAEKLALSEDDLGDIRLGGLLHDIGKIGIPESILNKNGPLDAEEWEIMKQHVRYGEKLLDPLPSLSQVRDMVCYHHEMYDGSGYPEGLTGQRIPLGARIIAIADAYDTITSERIYKKAHTPAAALAELQRCAGTQFDPELVRLFVEAVQQLPSPIAEPVAVTSRETV